MVVGRPGRKNTGCLLLLFHGGFHWMVKTWKFNIVVFIVRIRFSVVDPVEVDPLA
jgi:hypothetical protein